MLKASRTEKLNKLSCKYVLKSSQKEQMLKASRTEKLNKVTGVNIVFGYAKQIKEVIGNGLSCISTNDRISWKI